MNKKTSPDDDLSASKQPLNGSVRPQIAGSSDAATPSGHQPEPSPPVTSTTGVSVFSSEQPSDSRKSTASLRAPRRLPTADDYNQYMDNLIKIQEFIGNLESILGNCEVDDELDLNVELIRDLVTYYLEPLRHYQNDIRDIRNQITPSICNAPEALVEMLTYFEPQFKSVVDKLDRVRKKIDVDLSTAESSTDRNAPTSSEKPGVTKKRKQHQPEGFVATAQAGRKLEEWIKDIRSRKKDGKTTWRLDRRSDNFLQVVCDRYELAKDYELQRDLEIIFEDETSSDQGAVIREFFQSAFQNTMDDKFKDTRLLFGDVGHVLPDTTDDHLTHAFTFIGKMIAHAVYNGCRGLPGLSHALQAYLVYGKGPAHIEELRPPVSIDDVWEPDLHEVLSKLQSGTDLTERNRSVLQEWMNHSDCRIVHNPKNRHLIIQDLLIYYVFKRRLSQIEALAAGLDLFGLRQFLRDNPTRENIAMVFPVPDDMVISPYKPKKKDDQSYAFSSTTSELDREPQPRPRKKPEPSGVIATASMGRSLEEWANDIKQMKRGEKTKWRLDRHSTLFLQMACEKYENANPDVELRRDLEIVFEGEQGSDQGALTREFFHLAFLLTMENNYKDARLMLGEEGHVLPDATGGYLIHAFECIGKMIAHAVCNGCRGLPGLSPALQAYLVYGKGPAHIEELRPPVSIDDVCEPDLHEVLSKLESGENLTRENEAVLQEWMDHSNCHIQLKHETRHLIIQNLLIYYVFKRRIGQIEALATGMDLFGLRKFLRENPTKENIAMVFPSPADFIISPEMFMAVVITRGESYDPKIWEYFEQFLQDLAKGAIGGQSIADLVRFLSGSPYLPGRVVISFGEAHVMPIAHACFNELQLPTRHDSYDTFREKMRDGIAHRDYALDGVDPEHQRLQDSLEIS